MSFNNNKTDATSGAGTAYPPGAPAFIPDLVSSSCVLLYSWNNTNISIKISYLQFS